jgi:hypothetical protein
MASLAVRLCALCALAAVSWMLSARRTDVSDPIRELDVDPGLLRPGDVILRRGRDVVSAIVLASDPGSRFSHAGIVVRIGRILGVAHVLPQDAAHPQGTALTETVSSFSSPDQASEVAVFRLRQPRSEVPINAARNALRYVKEKRRFDDSFSLETTSDLYCSEFVWRAFLEAGMDLVDGRFQQFSLPVRSGYFVLPSSLANSPHLDMVLDSKKEE